ncbi:MAG: tRNA (N6-threonylcarbamoyladenosine(37)-N6)-methyltransferase TrmO [Proteobacteria bacterium]|nr:tRNA (N6-threonylcarbamoyladenosine(37)-N6)-methyltransferase TrmO [Pseudomonadota bacterium]
MTARVIAVVHSPWTERHGTPRQPLRALGMESGIVDGTVELKRDIAIEFLQDLESFSHIWLLPWFHLNNPRRRPLVTPPRGGPKRGVLSTRAPHRPNPLGLSVVRLLKVEGRVLHVRGLDLLNGTPILDIKPYISDYDALPEASRGWLEDMPNP